jgi:3-deoxy-D-manno-octulosonate 8-phosphate phosphatase (KDO 8-P phosphatase)
MNKPANPKDIELIVFDVDGVLTRGTIIVNEDGSESKHFCVKDGHGIKLWQRSGGKAAFLSGRFSKPTQLRAEMVGVDRCLQGCKVKLPELKKLLKELNVPAEKTAFLGDDLLDLPAVKYVGLGAAVNDAVQELKDHADFVTENRGGEGAAREFIEHLLKSSGKWEKAVERYGL